MAEKKAEEARKDLPERPRYIYLETSVLDPVPPSLDHPELQQFLDLCKRLDIRVAIPTIVLAELAEHKKRDVRKAYSQVQNAVASLSRYSAEPPDLVVKRKLAAMLQEVEERLKATIADQAGIEIVENFNDLNRVIELAVHGVSPFVGEDNDRGFKDTIILLSIANHIQKINASQYYVIVSNDGDVDAGMRDLPEVKELRIVMVRSFREAIELLQRFESEDRAKVVLDFFRSLREYLLTEQEQIQTFILDNAAFTKFELVGPIGPFDVIQQISSLKLADVRSPLSGLFPSGQKRGRVKVSFIAAVELAIDVRKLPLPPFQKFKVGGEVPQPLTSEDRPSGTVIMKVSKDLLVRGSIVLNLADPDQTWADLSLESVEVAPQEWFDLEFERIFPLRRGHSPSDQGPGKEADS